MMEATEAKTELVSPPQAHLPWGEGDNSPLLGTNSPFDEDFFGKAPGPETSTEHRTEPKQIADGFLSEVSTPDHGPKHKKRRISPGGQNEHVQTLPCIYPHNGCTQDGEEERNVFDFSPPRSLPDMGLNGRGREELKDEENGLFFSGNKVEEVLQDPSISDKVLQKMNVVKEEPQATDGNSCEISDAPFNSDAPLRREVELGTANKLKRKYFLASDEKLQRKRLKSNLSERSRLKGTAQWPHLSEEELKKLRRVKNRESVERCRTKQRLRMEALQVEQTCLRLENKILKEATISIGDALQDISAETKRLKDHIANHDKEDSGSLEKELRREVHA